MENHPLTFKEQLRNKLLEPGCKKNWFEGRFLNNRRKLAKMPINADSLAHEKMTRDIQANEITSQI